jgi:hypothetical protein
MEAMDGKQWPNSKEDIILQEIMMKLDAIK